MGVYNYSIAFVDADFNLTASVLRRPRFHLILI